MADDTVVVSDGLVVSMDYTLRLENSDEIVDSTTDREPLQFVQGGGQIISGLEQQLYGMKVGDQKELVVAPADGYGDADPEAYQVVPLDAFPADATIEAGMSLQLQDNEGHVFQVHVEAVRPDGVLLDFNHPLAGKTLSFKIRIAGLREATEEELAHGHVHDGHEHEVADDED